MGMLLHRHWLDEQEATVKAEAEAQAKKQPKDERPKRTKKTKGEE